MFASQHGLVDMLLLSLIIISVLYETSSEHIGDKPNEVILDMDTGNMPNSYKFHYNSSDGSFRKEEGSILNQNTDQAALNVLGTVRWYDNKGQLYEMTYKAGKRGYRTIIRRVPMDGQNI